ncbi:prolyl oligopeptidase family serine peptidase [Candidatus Sulfidibacterium hydrothermale]|uniref:S9 family peptidase n=1 Tax=Candidatus Sulfidibacterium hydrothermale TaxID=2875962 RepID=UPI001F0ADC85|nr:prolyl oligopeptidase family serine peptidase [Candidatus Sulfidibacterium hydrothermale]UBM61505.1 prolyl oligopeptidase family serine peptidase [Candidatus Sulfidibacterium hydrothermale]
MKKNSLFLFVIFFLFVWKVYSQDTTTQSLSVTRFLIAGPQTVQMPAFPGQPNLEGKIFQPVDLLKYNQKEVTDPVNGKVFLFDGKKPVKWQAESSDAVFPANFKTPYAIYRQAFYLRANRFVKLTLKAKSPQPFEIFIKKEKKLSQYQFQKKADFQSTTLTLEPGKYLVAIKWLAKKGEKTMPVKISLLPKKSYPVSSLSLSLSDKQFMDIDHLLLGQKLTSVSLNDDGTLIMLRYSETYPPKGETEKWFEIKNISTGKVLFSSQHSNLKQAAWVPGKQQISYLTKDGPVSALKIYDLTTHKEKLLMKTPEKFTQYTWSPNGNFIIYSIREKYTKNKSGVFKLEGMPDRWPWYRQRTQLYLFRLADHSTCPLTHGYLTQNLQDISPDGSHILFSESFPDYTQRPYTRQIMMQMNLKTRKVDTIWNAHFGGTAVYSPDGKKLLVTGSAAMFHGAGIHLKKAKIPNDFDIQAYIYTIATKKVKPITKNYNPSIEQAWWNLTDGQIYFLSQDRTYVNLWKYNPANQTFHALPVKTDVITRVSFARKAPVVSYCGSNISYPTTGWVYNLENSQQQKIADPEKNFFARVQFGKTEDWNFKNDKGTTIEGRIYYPPNYDPQKKYPLLVYYYGGTVPTSRDFGGRYPKNLFAAMGYIVYDLQPSGATGYGQDFSAIHVNGWGKQNAKDIIEGTKKFIQAHPQVNPKAVACLGASYGGYMTMWLQTQTDIFTTAIAHAGISDITSYWGQGYWGYLYSSVASANSFPWNNKKLYVDHSPLFLANKIHTPMLLLHGTADTNVPTGESIQLYTALKLLGRPVELVEIEGQNHHIIEYNKRILWQKTIFAWLAKYLKDQPQWWNYMYPKKDL